MHDMEYPPGGPMRPDIIRPTGVNPVGKMEKLFGFPIFPGRPVQVPFQKELGRRAYFTR
jgi:hypothetical protein